MTHIPREFHTYWKNQAIPSFAKPWIDSWTKHNPNFQTHCWNELEICVTMKNVKSDFLNLFKDCKSLYGRMRIAEYFVLEHYGGVFFDMDTRCMKSFEDLVSNRKLFMGLEPQEHAQKYGEKFIIGSAIVGSVPRHRLWRIVHDMIEKNIREGIEDPDVAYGSIMLTDAVKQCKDWIESESEIYDSSIFYPISNVSTKEEARASSVKQAFCIHYWRDFLHPSSFVAPKEDPTVLICILARNKAHLLPLYLKSIESLDYPKDRIHVFINTNDNKDDTYQILLDWSKKLEQEYASIEIEYGHNKALDDDRSLSHSWGSKRVRLDILARIRQSSLKKTFERKCQYYFVVDCDNFVLPHTLRDLIACQKPIVAPLLHCIGDSNLSNFFITSLTSPVNNEVQDRKIKMKERGIFPASLVHNTYLIDAKYISRLSYEGREGSFEFANFSVSAKKQGIGQYVCNKRFYGIFLHYFKTVENESRLIKEEASSLQSILDNMVDDHNDNVQDLLKRVSVSNLTWVSK